MMSTVRAIDRFAEAVDDAVGRAARARDILAVGIETTRIARETGLAPWLVAARLIEAGRRAQVAMELPTAEQLGLRSGRKTG
jgi:hypothetical protein